MIALWLARLAQHLDMSVDRWRCSLEVFRMTSLRAGTRIRQL
jgi:hypothetical protein